MGVFRRGGKGDKSYFVGLDTCSQGTDNAGVYKKFCASKCRCGKWVVCVAQHFNLVIEYTTQPNTAGPICNLHQYSEYTIFFRFSFVCMCFFIYSFILQGRQTVPHYPKTTFTCGRCMSEEIKRRAFLNECHDRQVVSEAPETLWWPSTNGAPSRRMCLIGQG